MIRRLFAAALSLLASPALALDDASIPSKFPIPWANSAGAAYVSTIPTASQIGITNCAASLTDGFPPLTFTPAVAGGCPPFGKDFNGILKQITQWSRWQQAGAPVFYDASFSSSIGGYPKSAILKANAANTLFWLSTVDNNTSDPDSAGANWTSFNPVATLGNIAALNAGNGLAISGSDLIANLGSGLTFSGASIVLAASGATPGIYGPASTITVDTFGRITSISTQTSGATPGAYGPTPNITVDTYGRVTAIATATSGVSAGSYITPQITVDVYGRVTAASTRTLNTRISFATATTALYLPGAGITRIFVRIIGSGGGGGSSGAAGTNGGAGGASSLYTMSAGGGGGGLRATAPSPGTGAGGAGGCGTGGPAGAVNICGGSGASGSLYPSGNPTVSTAPSGSGGNSVFGGGGGGGHSAASPTGGGTNSGGGGAGGAGIGTIGAGGGGGAGGYSEAWFFAPLSPGLYTLGAGGVGGTGSSGGSNGTNGALGIIIIDEYYD